ncbi:MAG: hypothetical protein NW201_11845 [Gemmatimonadales bacterium]|nr:hypothetical protein [Gemmatimonadales bacterium]
MPSLWDVHTAEQTLARLNRLDPGSVPRWGRFTAPAMLCHLGDALRQAVGDVQVPPVRDSPYRGAIVRWLAIHVLPIPRGRLDAPPFMLVTQPSSWELDLFALKELVHRGVARAADPAAPWPDNVLFGPLSAHDWGVLQWRHCDHHLRQFNA